MITKSYSGGVDMATLVPAVTSAIGSFAGWYMNSWDTGVDFIYDTSVLSATQVSAADTAINNHISKAAARAHNAPIKAQIVSLEMEITIRRIREAVLGTDGGWLKNQDAQIAAQRANLQPE